MEHCGEKKLVNLVVIHIKGGHTIPHLLAYQGLLYFGSCFEVLKLAWIMVHSNPYSN